MTSAPPLVLDPRSYEYHENPFDQYRRLRQDAPVYWNDELRFWALSRYADIARACTEWRTYVSGEGVTLRGPHVPPQLISQDPPRHTVLRGLVRSAFSARQVTDLESAVRALCRTLLDQVEGAAQFDVVADYSDRVPMAVIAWVLGTDPDETLPLHGLINRSMYREPGTSQPTAAGREAEAEALATITDLLGRERLAPGNGLIGRIARAQSDGTITADESVGMVYQLLIAGYETTTKLVGNAVHALHHAPDQRAILLSEPESQANAIEETLRYDGPTPHMFRTATREVNFHGRTISPGDKVLLLFASANRDERRWSDPDRFDIRRDTRGHLGFGHGIHLCLGAALARLEGRVALGEFLARFPRFEVDTSRAERSHTDNNRGFVRLPVTTGA
jgi:cytochrome P450